MLKKRIIILGLSIMMIVTVLVTPINAFASKIGVPAYDSKTIRMYNDLYEQDRKAINEIYQKLPDMLEEGEELARNDAKSSLAQPRGASYGSLGSYGDILVSLIINSGSVGFAGHAAIVSSDSTKTIESYAKKWSPIKKDGVQYYRNTWNKKSGALLIRPKGATSLQFKSAASYAAKQVGKPYNWNFTDKNTTSKFYCSQLVWRAWMNQGINCETGSVPNAIIAPADLVNSSNTYVVRQVQ